MLYLLLSITLVVIFLHLYAKYKEIKSLAFWTKPFLIPLIFITFFLLAKANGLTISQPLVLIGVCVFYTLGDILLLFENKNFAYLATGASFFLCGHLLNIYYFISNSFSIYAFLVALVVWLFMFILYSKTVIDLKLDSYIPVLIYGASICLLGIGIMSAYDSFNIFYLLGILGTASFALSDTLIAFNVIGKIKRRPFTIMSTYLLANILILAGVWGILI